MQANRDDVAAAETYDLVYAEKDFTAEATAARDLIREKSASVRTLLDVGCGTGRHIEVFSRWFECFGVDIDPGLIEVAKRRCPDVPFEVADMATLRLNRQFDAIVSFFGTIAYARDRKSLARVLENLAGHLSAAGVFVIEPWYSPETLPEWSVKADFIDNEGLKIARIGRAIRGNGRVRLEYEYLRGTSDKIEHFARSSEIGLFEHRDYLAAFDEIGFEAAVVTRGGSDFVVATRR